MDAAEYALDLLTGRWRSQVLHAGVKLGIVDALEKGASTSSEVSGQLDLSAAHTYRLMRALGSIGILEERAGQQFALTPAGKLFLSSHPQSLRGVCLWEEGPVLVSVWKHLPDIVRDGGPDGFQREFQQGAFEYIPNHVGDLFNEAMTSYSMKETGQVLEALGGAELSGTGQVVDIGGGYGYLLCSLLNAHPHLQGTVLEMAETLKDPEDLLAAPMGVADRCHYVAGDMFEHVPGADVYLLKHVLHDWNDEECVQILKNARRATDRPARVFIAEYVVPGPDTPDFSKLFDIHMMAVLTGRERTESEFAALLERAGWRFVTTWTQPEGSMAVVEGVSS